MTLPTHSVTSDNTWHYCHTDRIPASGRLRWSELVGQSPERKGLHRERAAESRHPHRPSLVRELPTGQERVRPCKVRQERPCENNYFPGNTKRNNFGHSERNCTSFLQPEEKPSRNPLTEHMGWSVKKGHISEIGLN